MVLDCEWDDIRNLGPQVNTSEDELFPYVRQDGRLYFSSKGHPGYGGLDLFYATRQDTIWEIFNMGTPFNTNADDFGITFFGNEERGLFSSNRKEAKGVDKICKKVGEEAAETIIAAKNTNKEE